MASFINRNRHEIVRVQDSEGGHRNVCSCQVKERHITDEDRVQFPVFECPQLTRKMGFGTENGIQK